MVSTGPFSILLGILPNVIPVGSWEPFTLLASGTSLCISPNTYPPLLHTYVQIPDPLYFVLFPHLILSPSPTFSLLLLSPFQVSPSHYIPWLFFSSLLSRTAAPTVWSPFSLSFIWKGLINQKDKTGIKTHESVLLKIPHDLDTDNRRKHTTRFSLLHCILAVRGRHRNRKSWHATMHIFFSVNLTYVYMSGVSERLIASVFVKKMAMWPKLLWISNINVMNICIGCLCAT